MDKCEWTFIGDVDNHYVSECGGEWFFFEGTTTDNQMDICPFCGEPLYEAEPAV